MELGAYYTEGSNRIKVEIYSEPSDITINLLNANVSDAPVSLLSSTQETSKYIDRSIKVEPHHFIDNHATVYFNFLDFDISTYLIEAVQNNTSQLYNIHTIEVMDSKEQPYLEDHISDIQNVSPTDIQGDVFNEIPGDPILDIDYTQDSIINEGSATVNYQGGGNRYLIDDNGILVLQAQSCQSINDRYSPFQLNTTIKCENSVTNKFTKFEYDSTKCSRVQTQVQKGLNAFAYKAFGKNNIELQCDVNLNGTHCFSVLLASDSLTKCKLCINSQEKEVEVSQEYSMFYITGSCIEDTQFKIICEDYSVRLFVLLPQIELNNYPTSRVLSNKTRIEDRITVQSNECNVVFDPNGSENDIVGGFLNIKFISARQFSNDNAIIDWRNAGGKGLLIYQETEGSIVATFGDGYTVRSLPVVMEEGEEYNIKVQWDMNNLGIQVNDEEPILIMCPEIPMPEDYPNEIKIGWSESHNSLNCDIVSLQIGQ